MVVSNNVSSVVVVDILNAPVIDPPASGNFVAILVVTVVLKLASSPSAAANSFRVFSVLGALSVILAIILLEVP